LLEYDGKFEEIIDKGDRKDRILWSNMSDIMKGNMIALKQICKKIISIPFELNAKANFAC